MSVWKRVRQYANDAVTSIIHGKAWHEETKATSSRAMANGGGHYLVVFTLAETDYVCDYILKGGNKEEFLAKFKGAYSAGFDPDVHLQAIGVANQTTMLRGETEEVQRRIRAAMEKRYGCEDLDKHYRFFDTICGATQDRQDALENCWPAAGPVDCDRWLQFLEHLASGRDGRGGSTYFIKNASKMVSEKLICHHNLHLHQEVQAKDWLPGPSRSASRRRVVSNNLIEDTIRRLFELRASPCWKCWRS
jgi:4-hydroxy-3-methylbut-2-enyl diphosphate reductase